MADAVAEPEASVLVHWQLGGLFLLTLVTGIVDATSYLGLGQVFTANMTGNVLLLGFSSTTSTTGYADPLSLLGGLVALGAFVAGALLGAAVGGRRRVPARPAAGFVVEWALLAAAAGLLAATSAHGALRYVVLALLGGAMGVQNAVVRRMGVPDVNTTVLTTTLGGLAADVVLVGGKPARAGRRVATVLLLFLGAVVGGALEHQGARWSALAALVAMMVAVLSLARSGAFGKAPVTASGPGLSG